MLSTGEKDLKIHIEFGSREEADAYLHGTTLPNFTIFNFSLVAKKKEKKKKKKK